MRVLIVGNGFDIAHGLPTKYTDFLYFVKALNDGMTDAQNHSFYDVGEYSKHLDGTVTEYLNNALKDRSDIINEIKFLEERCVQNKFISFSDLELTFTGKQQGYRSLKEILLGDEDRQLHLAVIVNIHRLLKDNYWIIRFEEAEKYNQWVDFESEIAKTCLTLEMALGNYRYGIDDNERVLIEKELFESFSNYFINDDLKSLFNLTEDDYEGISFPLRYNDSIKGDRRIAYSFRIKGLYKIRKILIDSLERLIFAFELYLIHIVENTVLPNVKKLFLFRDLHINKLLSFNYTHTWQEKYGEIDIQYLHGSTRNSKDLLDIQSPLVLGMNESLEGSEVDNNTNLIKFKKYYQRIRKNTDGDYKKWIEYLEFEDNIKRGHSGTCYDIYQNEKNEVEVRIIENALVNEGDEFQEKAKKYFDLYYKNDTVSRDNSSCVYIYGHSLDVTDKDILRSFIDYDNIKIIIFYLDDNDLDVKIENLVKIIGHDNLIKRRGSSRQTIYFRNIVTGEDI